MSDTAAPDDMIASRGLSIPLDRDVLTSRLIKALVGPQPGVTPFHVRSDMLASSMDRMDGTKIISRESVEIRDARSESRRIKPTSLICEIEGAEQMVIPLLDLSTVRSAVIELHPQWIGADGVRTVFQAMMDAGPVYAARRSVAKVVCFKRNF